MTDLFVYDQWNAVKKGLELEDKVAFFKQGQLWWLSVGYNIGTEVYGKGSRFTRPVLVLKKISGRQFLGVPLTSKTKEVSSWYCTFLHNGKEMTAMLYQARVFDKKRFLKLIGQIDDTDLLKVRMQFQDLFCT